MAPLAAVGAGFTAVTLSACYGPACAATKVTLLDGGSVSLYGGLDSNAMCHVSYDCRTQTPDGGDLRRTGIWKDFCCEPTEVTLFDGGHSQLRDQGANPSCTPSYDCRDAGHAPDGGDVKLTVEWQDFCEPGERFRAKPEDGGTDGGS